MVLKYKKESNIVCVSYITGCLHLKKFMVFVNTRIILDRPIKWKSHTVSCLEKCVSFKDI